MLSQAIGAYGLRGQQSGLPVRPLEARSWQALLKIVSRERLAGLLVDAIARGDFPATTAQWEEATKVHLQWCGTALRLEQRLLVLRDLFGAAGIEFLVLKGTAVAHLDYPDPASRLFGDLDLLVRSEQFDPALRLLCDAGYVRPRAQARDGFDRRFGKGATLEGTAGDEVDLHRNLMFGTFGFTIDLEELFRSSVAFEVGGRPFRALGAEVRLLHACYHAALGDPVPRSSSVRDIAQMLVNGAHDDQRVIDLAVAWRARAVVHRAVGLCREHLGVAVDGPLVRAFEDYRPDAREERAIASYVGANRRFAAKVLASLPFLDGTRERAAFLRAAVAPDPEFVTSHGGRPGWPWIERGLRALLRGRG